MVTKAEACGHLVGEDFRSLRRGCYLRTGKISSGVVQRMDEASSCRGLRTEFRPKKAAFICKKGSSIHVRMLRAG